MEGSGTEGVFLSVVIPVFNEEGNIDVLLEQLEDTLQPLNVSYELILVDDGSSDGSWRKIHEMSQTNTAIKGLKLARNFGHQHALLAGLNYAKGQAVVSMDADLQHPPFLIRELLEGPPERTSGRSHATGRDDRRLVSETHDVRMFLSSLFFSHGCANGIWRIRFSTAGQSGLEPALEFRRG